MTDAYLQALIQGARQSHFGAQILWHAWQSGDIAPEQLAQYLTTAWAKAGTRRYLALSRPQWRELFDAQGFTRNGVPDTPPARVELYRAAPLEYRDNWSWTPRVDVAQYYAAERDCPIWVVTAPAHALLAYRSVELLDLDEYIADTRGLEITEHIE
jgi:hypothetical protein